MVGMVLSGACEQPCIFQGARWVAVEGKEQLRTLSSQQLFELHEQAEPKIQIVLGDFRGQISI